MASPSSSSSSRKRTTNRQHSAEDQALSQVAKEAESRLAAKRAARTEAREIRSREVERQQREQEEREKNKTNDLRKDYTTSNSRYVAQSAIATNSRRGSDDSSEDSYRDLRRELLELEEKFKRAMMNNAQLDNEKQVLRYQVDLLRDQLEEMEEQSTEMQRELKERNRELDHKKRDFTEQEVAFEKLKEQLEQRDALILEHGLVFVSDEAMQDEPDGTKPKKSEEKKPIKAALISPEALETLENHSGSLDERLRKFADDKKALEKEIRKLKQELEVERERRTVVDRYKSHSPTPNLLSNGPSESPSSDAQAEMLKQLTECKFKLKKAEQEITTLEGNVIRLESQVKRFKTAADNAEKVEEELKAEKRRFQKELREVQTAKDELELDRNHLLKRLEKMKSSRTSAK